MPLRCKVFARLNNCANGDEADVSFVQTQKTQSHYYLVNNINLNHFENIRDIMKRFYMHASVSTASILIARIFLKTDNKSLAIQLCIQHIILSDVTSIHEVGLRVRAVFHKTVRVCHVYCNFKLGLTCRITVIIGTLKDGSLLINT